MNLCETAGSSKRKVVPPKIVVTKVANRLEHCERHVPQLLVRGEQVVYINVLDK